MKPTDRTLAARELRRMARWFRTRQRQYEQSRDVYDQYSADVMAFAADACLSRARELEGKRGR